MKKWIEYFYGIDTLPKTAILSSGTTSKPLQKRLAESVGNVAHYKDDIQQYYLANTDNGMIALVFNLLGASAMIDTLHILSSGGNEEFYFVSFAGTKERYDIGDYFLPTGAKCLDGVTNLYLGGKEILETDPRAIAQMRQLLKSEDRVYHEGLAATLPAVFHNHPNIEKAINSDGRIKSYEMELSSALYFSGRNGQVCYPVFVISDNEHQNIPDSIIVREESFERLFALLCRNIK